jgi:hypothetical protein
MRSKGLELLLYHKNGSNGARDNQPHWVFEPYSASGIRDHCAPQFPFLQSGIADYSSSYPWMYSFASSTLCGLDSCTGSSYNRPRMTVSVVILPDYGASNTLRRNRLAQTSTSVLCPKYCLSYDTMIQFFAYVHPIYMRPVVSAEDISPNYISSRSSSCSTVTWRLQWRKKNPRELQKLP